MPADSAENWKERYLSSVDRLERRERQLEEVEALMRDGIARLSVIAEGQDPGLDAQLQRLRKSVRGQQDVVAVRRLLDATADLARSLDDDQTRHLPPAGSDVQRAAAARVAAAGGIPAAGAASDPRALLAVLLDELRLPEPDSARLQEIGGELASACFDEELRALSRKAAAVINRALGDAALRAGPASEAAPATGDLLVQLLNCIAVPLELGPRMEAIKAQLVVGPSAAEWPSVLHGIADLIAEMRARIEAEKSELENFLMQLTDRLRDLDEHLQSAQNARQASFQGGQQLERRMHDEMGQIESGVRQAANLGQLKDVVRSRLDVIRVHLEEHRRSEAERQAELEQRLEHMTMRLRSVEQETVHLRAHLRKRKIQAMSDPLTGIANRAAFEDRLQREHGRWKRYRHPLGFMIMDVDHFKQINDSYGHKAGDRALKLIAQVLRQSLRETDFIARYGGEEFVALLPETATAQVAEVAEKLRCAIEGCSFHHRGVRVPITLSIGYCEFRGDDTGEDVFQRADVALYRAKADGRNRCRGSVPPESQRPGERADRR